MKVEVHAVRLKAMREKRGLTQRRLAHDPRISQN
jgi:transcriptional regulator with XRE-family HTH domain